MIGGHGHVVPRADGIVAKCGGPAICAECKKEQAAVVDPPAGRRLGPFDSWLDELDDCVQVGGGLDRVKARTVLLAFASHVRRQPAPKPDTDPITDDWLREVGFKWHQFDRQPAKQWLLWLGDAMGDKMTSYEDIGIELAPMGHLDSARWFCWLRGDSAGRYHRFIHVRHLESRAQLIRMVEGLTGQTWNPANHYAGAARTPEQAARIHAENAARADRMGKWPAWADVEKDDTRGRALPEHMQVAEDVRTKDGPR